MVIKTLRLYLTYVLFCSFSVVSAMDIAVQSASVLIDQQSKKLQAELIQSLGNLWIYPDAWDKDESLNHGEEIEAICVSSNNEIATASENKRIKIWDLATGKLLFKLPCSAVTAMSIVGRELIVGRTGMTVLDPASVELYNLDTGINSLNVNNRSIMYKGHRFVTHICPHQNLIFTSGLNEIHSWFRTADQWPLEAEKKVKWQEKELTDLQVTSTGNIIAIFKPGMLKPLHVMGTIGVQAPERMNAPTMVGTFPAQNLPATVREHAFCIYNSALEKIFPVGADFQAGEEPFFCWGESEPGIILIETNRLVRVENVKSYEMVRVEVLPINPNVDQSKHVYQPVERNYRDEIRRIVSSINLNNNPPTIQECFDLPVAITGSFFSHSFIVQKRWLVALRHDPADMVNANCFIVVIDIQTGNELAKANAHNCTSLFVTSDGLIIAADKNGRVRKWGNSWVGIMHRLDTLIRERSTQVRELLPVLQSVSAHRSSKINNAVWKNLDLYVAQPQQINELARPQESVLESILRQPAANAQLSLLTELLQLRPASLSNGTANTNNN